MMGLSQMKRIPPRWIDRPTVDQLKPLTSCFFTVTFTVATAVFTPRHTTLPALELRPTLPSRARVFQFKKGKEKKHFVGTKRADGRRLQQVLRKRWTENGLVHYPNSGPSSAGDSSWAIYFLFCRCPFVKQVHGFFHCFFFFFSHNTFSQASLKLTTKWLFLHYVTRNAVQEESQRIDAQNTSSFYLSISLSISLSPNIWSIYQTEPRGTRHVIVSHNADSLYWRSVTLQTNVTTAFFVI